MPFLKVVFLLTIGIKALYMIMLYRILQFRLSSIICTARLLITLSQEQAVHSSLAH